jgi:RNA polymerase sigma-B factor
MSSEDVLSAMEAHSASRASSLDAGWSGEDGETEPAIERVGHDDESYELIDGAATIAPALKELPERERRILYLRLVEDMTQSEIARHIGVSQMQVSRLIRQTLGRLNEAVAPDDPTASTAMCGACDSG